jgi:hypothetical protein
VTEKNDDVNTPSVLTVIYIRDRKIFLDPFSPFFIGNYLIMKSLCPGLGALDLVLCFFWSKCQCRWLVSTRSIWSGSGYLHRTRSIVQQGSARMCHIEPRSHPIHMHPIAQGLTAGRSSQVSHLYPLIMFPQTGVRSVRYLRERLYHDPPAYLRGYVDPRRF